MKERGEIDRLKGTLKGVQNDPERKAIVENALGVKKTEKAK